jgi:hypothetical protein
MSRHLDVFRMLKGKTYVLIDPAYSVFAGKMSKTSPKRASDLRKRQG